MLPEVIHQVLRRGDRFSGHPDESPAEAVAAVHRALRGHQNQCRLSVLVLYARPHRVGVLPARVELALQRGPGSRRNRHAADRIVRIVRIYQRCVVAGYRHREAFCLFPYALVLLFRHRQHASQVVYCRDVLFPLIHPGHTRSSFPICSGQIDQTDGLLRSHRLQIVQILPF